MAIIGYSPQEVEDNRASSAGALPCEALECTEDLQDPVVAPRRLASDDSNHGPSSRQAAATLPRNPRADPWRFGPGRKAEAQADFAEAMALVREVWSHLPEDSRHQLRQRLLLLARRFQEARPSNPFSTGGSQ